MNDTRLKMLGWMRLGLLCVLAGFCSVALGQTDSLDDDLFSDLAPLEQDLPDIAKPPQEIDRELQRELGGEDLGQKRSTPMQELVETMRSVGDRIQRKRVSAETQEIQGKIVRSFDEMIQQLRQQKQKQRSGQQQKNQQQQQKKPQQSPSKSPPKQKKPGDGKPGDKPSNQPANDSSTRLGSAEPAEASADARDRMMQDAWGNLPAGVQQQMQSSRPEKFLPKYSRLIEEYFKRLSEDKRDR